MYDPSYGKGPYEKNQFNNWENDAIAAFGVTDVNAFTPPNPNGRYWFRLNNAKVPEMTTAPLLKSP
jgi:hypothetical protein